MKVRSLQFRFLRTVLAAILTVAIFIGGLSIYEMNNYVHRQTIDLIEVTCENEATKINVIFENMEKSVKIMEAYVLSFFKSEADIENREKQNQVIQFADKMFVNVAQQTDSAIAYYLRLDPTISDNTAGVFYSKMNGGDEYVRLTPTDISLYDKNDTEHVGWYWQPYEAGHPIWMTPYYNQNNNVLMISYVVPLYFEDSFIGVLGMDFDYKVLTEVIHRIKIYEHGFAHLELNGVVIHEANEGSTASPGFQTDREKHLRSSRELTNGMTLVLSANYDDMRQIRYDIAYKILLIILVFVLAFSGLVIWTVKKMVKPLKKLTAASIKLSKGDYDVEIDHCDTLEINMLSTTFENMIMNLREHKDLQHRLAHRDSLTGLRNTTSYQDWVVGFDKKIQEGNVFFGVMVLDINNLKEINDTYGHILGNELIVTVSRIISETFKRSPVFRIGGDEFLVLLQNKDLADKDELLTNFDLKCAETHIDKDDVSLPISIAKGFSRFNPDKDTQFSDVFERADHEMYKHKKKMKALRL